MTERIDHYAEAERVLHECTGLIRGGAAQTSMLAAAQVHATLALAEQARIANIIALAESGRTTVNGARTALAGLFTGSAEDGSANMHLRPEIKEALGLHE